MKVLEVLSGMASETMSGTKMEKALVKVPHVHVGMPMMVRKVRLHTSGVSVCVRTRGLSCYSCERVCEHYRLAWVWAIDASLESCYIDASLEY